MSFDFSRLLPNLTPINELNALIENRKAYTLSNCELAIYETNEQAMQVGLRLNEWSFLGMYRGRKVMHFEGDKKFDYLPGSSLLVSPNQPMKIDFPDSDIASPTQCVVFSISQDLINNTWQLLNDQNVRLGASNVDFSKDKFSLFTNNTLVKSLLNITRLMTEQNGKHKETYINVALQDLLSRYMQANNNQSLKQASNNNLDNNRFADVIFYIKQHLHEDINIEHLCKLACMSKVHFYRLFKHVFGVTPLEFISQERINMAKELLLSHYNVKETAFEVGYNDVNYFIRQFKSMEGVTPKKFQSQILQ